MSNRVTSLSVKCGLAIAALFVFCEISKAQVISGQVNVPCNASLNLPISQAPITDLFVNLNCNVTSSQVTGNPQAGMEIVLTISNAGGFTFAFPSNFLPIQSQPSINLSAGGQTTFAYQYCGIPGFPNTCPSGSWSNTDVGPAGSGIPTINKTVLASDTFIRPNENPLNPANWAIVPSAFGPLQIINNTLQSVASGVSFGDSEYFSSFINWSSDQFATVTIKTMGTATTSNGGVTCRVNPAAPQTFYTGQIIGAAGGVGNPLSPVLTRLNNNTTETWMAYHANGNVVNANDVIEMDCRGNLFILRLNGAPILLAVDQIGTRQAAGSYLSGGYPGVHIFEAVSNGNTTLGPWTAGNLGNIIVQNVYDNFSRTSASLGTNWTYSINGFSATGAAAKGGTSGDANVNIYAGSDFTPDQFCETKLLTINGVTDFEGCGVRFSGSGDINGGQILPNVWGYVINENNATLSLQKYSGWQNGSPSFSTITSTSASGAAGDILRLEVIGQNLRGYRNGVMVFNTNDSSISNGYPAIVQFGNVGTMTNFAAGNITSIAQQLPSTDTLPFQTLCTNITTVTVNANVATDQSLMSCPIPVNKMNSVGRNLKVSLSGVYSTPAASTSVITIKAKICTQVTCSGGTVITAGTWTTTALAAVQATNNQFNIEDAKFSVQTAGSSATLEAHGNLVIDLGVGNLVSDTLFADVNTATVGGIDTTVLETLLITISFSNASASNSATQRQMVLEMTN